MILAILIIVSLNLALFLLVGLAAITSGRRNALAQQQALLNLIANAQQSAAVDSPAQPLH